MNRKQITEALTSACVFHYAKKNYSCHVEIAVGEWNAQRLDILCFNYKREFIGIEVKSCVADYTSDKKWRNYLETGLMNKFYFCITKKMWDNEKFRAKLKEDLKPHGVGIIVLWTNGYVTIKQNAKRMETKEKALHQMLFKMAWRGGDSRRNIPRRKRIYIYDNNDKAIGQEQDTTDMALLPDYKPVHKRRKSKKFKQYRYTLGGRELWVQGFEPQALDYLQNYFKVEDILTEYENKVPVIRYKYSGKHRDYIPDIFIRNHNIIVEVKSTHTLGLFHKKKRGWSMTCAKALACKERGYKFALLLMEANGNRLKLPKNWPKMKKEDVAYWVKEHNRIKTTLI